MDNKAEVTNSCVACLLTFYRLIILGQCINIFYHMLILRWWRQQKSSSWKERNPWFYIVHKMAAANIVMQRYRASVHKVLHYFCQNNLASTLEGLILVNAKLQPSHTIHNYKLDCINLCPLAYTILFNLIYTRHLLLHSLIVVLEYTLILCWCFFLSPKP